MQDHLPYIPLSQLVQEFCLAQFNDRRKFYLNYMVHAKWIYKDLFLKSMFVTKNKYVKVDKTTNPYSIVIPVDCLRFINLCTEDKVGRLRSYVFDDLINDVQLPSGKECKVCNETDDLGACFNSMVPLTKQVIINGEPYTEKIWKKLCPNGDILEIRETPALDDTEVKTILRENWICNVELKSCGCIKKSKQNTDSIVSVCGNLVPERQLWLSSPTINRVGTKQGRIKIRDGRIWINGNVPDWMILSYQTNGSSGECEIMVPEYAVESMMFGINWRSTALAPNKGGRDKQQSRIDYDRAVEEMEMFLNPIRVEEFMNVQMALPLWGSAIDQSMMRGDNCWYECHDMPALPNHGGLMTPEDVSKLIAQQLGQMVVINTYSIQSGYRVYTQESPALEWLIVHDLGRNPTVTITDLDGDAMDGLVSYPADNISVLIKFNSPVAGKVIFSA